MNECGYYIVERATNIRCMNPCTPSFTHTLMVFDTRHAADKWIDHGVRSHTLIGECPKESIYAWISIAEYNRKYSQYDERTSINDVTKRDAILKAIELQEDTIRELRCMIQSVD